MIVVKKLKLTRSDFFLLGSVALLFFLVRLPSLTLLPVFADEAIYLRWAQVMRAEPSLRFLPLSDGKQPLYMWLVMIGLRFGTDPLWLGRFVSVVAGLGTLSGLLFLTWLLFGDKKISFLTGLFYAVVPYFVFFDRMALVDSLLLSLGVWTLALAVWLRRKPRLDLAMITGIVLGAAWLTKSPALFFVLLLPTTFLTTKRVFKDKKVWSKLIRLFGFWLVVWLFGFAIYNLLRLGPGFAMIASRNKDYVFSLKEVLSHPLDPLKPHLGDLVDWLPNLFTWPLFGLALWGLVLGFLKKERRGQNFFLFLVSFVPILVQAAIARVFTPRYLLFAVWPFLIWLAQGALFWQKFLKRKFVFLVLALLILPLLYDGQLLSVPTQAPLPRRMRSGYLEEWSAGQGIAQIASFVKKRLGETSLNILVGTEGYFGTLPDGLQIYLEGERRVVVLGVGQPIRETPPQLLDALVDNEVYLVVNRSRMLVEGDSRLQLLQEYPKAEPPTGETDALLLYQLVRK